MKRSRAVFGLVLACALFAAADAVGAPGALDDRGAATAVLSDGDRWLLVVRDGAIQATDTTGGRRRALPLDGGCTPQSVHRGLLLVTCPVPRPGAMPGGPSPTYGKPYLTRLATGQMAAVPNDVLSSGESFGAAGRDPGWTEVGEQWLAGTVDCYHCEDTVSYVNWHTGERRSADRSEDLDLDDARLRPVSRRGGPRALPAPERLTGGILRVRVHGRWVVLSACRRGCGEATVGADRYAWTQDHTIQGYVPATGARASWRVPPGTSISRPVITRRRVAGTLVDAGGVRHAYLGSRPRAAG